LRTLAPASPTDEGTAAETTTILSGEPVRPETMTLTFAKTNLRFPLTMNRRGKIRNQKLPGQLNRTRALESHRMPGLSQLPSCRANLICMLAADSILESMENEAQFEKTVAIKGRKIGRR
jgi:hypothetical protein